MFNVEIKEKIVKSGNSRVFKNWSENSNVTMDDFIEGIRWLCADPLDDKGRYTRELGCIRRADAGMTDDEKAFWGPTPHQPGVDRIYRLTRSYDTDGHCTFYDEDGRAWGGISDCASINAGDRV